MSLFDSASLVVTPSGYKEDKLYSIKPTDGSGDLVVTRATTATRVNSAGLIEEVPYNLIQYSEQFDNGTWTKISSSITANSVTAPNGTLTADKFESTSAGVPEILQTTTNSNTKTISFYAKEGNVSTIALWVGSEVKFNLSTGVVISGAGTIESVGNGWYRCVVANTTFPHFNGYFISTASGQFVYIWGAQIVNGTSAKEYFPTTDRLNVPRLDYTNSSCPSILVEPQRTNLVTYSEQFDNGAWVKDNVSISANSVTSPSGIQNADSILETATTSTHTTYNRASMTSGQTYTQSCYFKANGRNRVIMQIFDNATQYANAIFDLSSGVVVASFGTATIQNMTNGWYRCTITGTSPATGLGYCVIGLCENTYSTPSVFPTYLGDITKGVYAWGFQVEQGSYATSYIPTVASSVTRNADVISKTGISSLIGQTEGTFFVDFYAPSGYDSDNLLFILSDNTEFNLMFINRNNGRATFAIVTGGVVQLSYMQSSVLSTGRHKVAFAYKQNDFAIYLDGALIHTDTNGNVPICNKLNLGSYVNNALPYNAGINVNALWKTRLTNAELAEITTL